MALITTSAGNAVGTLENYESLKFSRQFLKTGAVDLTINRNVENADLIEKGRLILPDEFSGNLNQIYLIEQIESEIDQSGRAGEFINVTGRSLGGMFEERLGLPPSGSAYDDRTDAAETLMKYWVDLHAVNPSNTNRTIPNLTVATDQARGGSISYKLRYQTIAEMLQEIGTANDIGWEISYDVSTNTYQFEVIIPTDKTAGSTNPVYFDIDFETILANRLLSSELEKKSYAYVGGSGEGSSRTIQEVFVEATEPSGLNRKEAFVDAGNLSDTANLTRKGEVYLKETIQEDVVEVDINTIGSFQYKTDWDLGDNITVINNNWNFQADVRIIGITIEVSEGMGQPDVQVQLGKAYPTIKSQVQRQVAARDDERARS